MTAGLSIVSSSMGVNVPSLCCRRRRRSARSIQVTIAIRGSSRVAHCRRFRTVSCSRPKKLSRAALSPAAPTRPTEPTIAWRLSACCSLRGTGTPHHQPLPARRRAGPPRAGALRRHLHPVRRHQPAAVQSRVLHQGLHRRRQRAARRAQPTLRDAPRSTGQRQRADLGRRRTQGPTLNQRFLWQGFAPCACGGAKGIRTPDLLIANETRYQLRHSPVCERRL